MGSHPLNYEPYPEVQPQAGGLARETINATPDMFGAAIGRGVEKLGQGIEHADNAIFDLATEQEKQHGQIHGAELHTFFSDKATDLSEKFTELKGAAALNALPQYKQDLNDLYSQVDQQA